ncbi:MAG TPA: alanine racemase [Haloplasmataceae bacterium]
MNEYCETYITINREALIHNAKYFKKISKKNLIAVIKSNAYGHGLLDVAKILEQEAHTFAVAALDSAIKLRENGIKIPILVLNPIAPKYVINALRNNIMVTVNNIQEVQEIKELIKNEDNILKVHIKVDSGMNRMGLKTKEECLELLNYINEIPNIKVVGIYTHFHSGDNPSYSKKQQDKFKEIYHYLNYDFAYVHLCATAPTLNNWDIEESTHVRIGLGLYGLCEDPNVIAVLAMYSRIMLRKLVNPQETVGYGARFQAQEKTWIGILPCGYSDGIIRSNVGRHVYVDGNYCEIIGSVCMNSLMIKLPHENTSDLVELIGPHISANEVAEYLNTISYEVVTYLPPHIKRIII